jgi:hypothetical protein
LTFSASPFGGSTRRPTLTAAFFRAWRVWRGRYP